MSDYVAPSQKQQQVENKGQSENLNLPPLGRRAQNQQLFSPQTRGISEKDESKVNIQIGGVESIKKNTADTVFQI